MANYKIFTAIVLGAGLLAACADNDILPYSVDKPQSIADYEYLKDFADLKTYIDRAAHPGFMFGTGVGAADYNSKGLVYRLTNHNFDIMTAGNAMKYASVVKDNGDMDFSTVTSFVENARAAGIKIYGHTLCWHEQQNVKYLNNLIKDKELEIGDEDVVVEDAFKNYQGLTKFPYYVMGYEPEIIDGILTVPEYPGSWYQFFVMDGLTFEEGREYVVTAKIRGSEDGELNVQLGDWGNLNEARMSFTTEWEEQSVKMNPSLVTSGFSVFQPGTYPGKLEIEWVKISHSEAPSIEFYESLITGGDAENGPCDNVISRVPGSGDTAAPVVDDPLGTGKVYAAAYNGNPVNAWDSQLFLSSNVMLNEGDKIHVKFRYRTTDARSVDTQAHCNPGEYNYWQFIGTLNCTTEWQDFEYKGTLSASHVTGDGNVRGCKAIAFNLCSAADAGTFYIDDVEFDIVKSGNTIPLTPEEKADILEKEMERWVAGMMEATEGYVTDWDVVNEAISGGPWGQRYDLQHAATDANAASKFYWQDYLGDDFVRIPVKYARQYFKEYGGNPDDLKLFINDYNLESDWDNNQKLKSLIQWIDQWESDGVTRIDGIGSQMHISYYMNPQTQASKEAAIENMLRLMAATGKLVRLTEFDMGLVDENGNDVPTDKVTLEQHKLMADYYEWIIKKYFEIIPTAQQHGITLWCQTDSPKGSGWRADSPVGIWDLNYNRKPAYAGVSRGLENK